MARTGAHENAAVSNVGHGVAHVGDEIAEHTRQDLCGGACFHAVTSAGPPRIKRVCDAPSHPRRLISLKRKALAWLAGRARRNKLDGMRGFLPTALLHPHS